jgi:hypothetical protein
MERIPVLDVEEIEPLAENPSLATGLNSQAMPRIDTPKRFSSLLKTVSIIASRSS